jgi:hypothetical protein
MLPDSNAEATMHFTTGATALLALAATLHAPQHADAQNKSFEGTVTFQASGEREGDNTFVYSMKGSRVRFEPQSAQMPMFMIMDLEDKVMRMVMTGQNMYMEVPIPEADGEDAPVSKNAPVNTGRTDEVAGRKCEIWTMTEDGRSYEMCVARDMGMFMQGGNPMARGRNAPPAWQRELRKGGFFPLRVAQVTGSGSKAVLVATKIEEKRLDDSMFAVPSGMQKMTMPPGMGGRRP